MVGYEIELKYNYTFDDLYEMSDKQGRMVLDEIIEKYHEKYLFHLLWKKFDNTPYGNEVLDFISEEREYILKQIDLMAKEEE